MVFIKLQKSTDVVEYIHYMPFDSVNGMKKTEEELLQEGMLLDVSIPEETVQAGKQALLHYNDTNSFYYTYVDRPLTPEEELEQLKQQVVAQQSAINMLLGV
jgi:hypothetical protein